MKKMSKFLVSVIAVLVTTLCINMTAFADEELVTVDLSVGTAVASNGSWGQSITYAEVDFSTTRLTATSQFLIEFELTGEAPAGRTPVELVFQNYLVEPQIWAKIAPIEYTETTATFDYDAMVAAYGDSDLSTVNNICVGDCGVQMIVTKVAVTNCTALPAEIVEEVTEKATEAATEEVTEKEAEEVVATTVEPKDTAAAETTVVTEETESKSGNGMTPIIIAIVVAVVVAVAVVTFIVIKKNKRRFY